MLSENLFIALLVTVLPSLYNCQSYGNLTYNRVDFLIRYHDQDFNVNTDDLQNSYIGSVLTLAIITTAILFLIFLVFEVFLFCRCCCKLCCACSSCCSEKSGEDTDAEKSSAMESCRKKLMIAFFVLLFLCCAVCPGVLVADENFSSGSDNAVGAVSDLKDISISLENSGLELDAQGDEVIALVEDATPSCPEASTVDSYAEEFEAQVELYLDVVGPLPDNLQNFEDFLNDWGGEGSDNVLYVLIAFLVMTVPFLIAFFLKNKCSMRLSICCGLLYLHVLLVSFCFFFIGLVICDFLLFSLSDLFTSPQIIMSDYCWAPTDNILSITPDSVLDEANYYLKCNGTNPLAEPIQEAYEAAYSLEQAVNYLTSPGGPCENNPYLLDCLPIIDDMYSEIDSIVSQLHCQPIQQVWGKIINDATCTDIYTGLFVLFWTVSLVIACYFALVVVSSSLYNYFGISSDQENVDNIRLVELYGASSSEAISGEKEKNDSDKHNVSSRDSL